MLDRRPVLAVDRLLGGDLVDLPAEGPRHAGERGGEQGAVPVGGQHAHDAVALGYPPAVGGSKLPIRGVRTDGVGDEPQLLEMRVPQGPVVEQGAGKVEEHGDGPP